MKVEIYKNIQHFLTAPWKWLDVFFRNSSERIT